MKHGCLLSVNSKSILIVSWNFSTFYLDTMDLIRFKNTSTLVSIPVLLSLAKKIGRAGLGALASHNGSGRPAA